MAAGFGIGVGVTVCDLGGGVDFGVGVLAILAIWVCPDLAVVVFVPDFPPVVFAESFTVALVTRAGGFGVGVGVGTTRGLLARGSGVGLPITIMVGFGFGGCAWAVNFGVGQGVGPGPRCVDLPGTTGIGVGCRLDFGTTRCGVGATGIGLTGVGVGFAPVMAPSILSVAERMDERPGSGCAVADVLAVPPTLLPGGIGIKASLPPPRSEPSCGSAI